MIGRLCTEFYIVTFGQSHSYAKDLPLSISSMPLQEGEMGEAQNTGISSQANDSRPAWIPAVKAIAEPLISDGLLPGLIVRVEPEAGAPEVLCLGSDWDGQPLEEG